MDPILKALFDVPPGEYDLRHPHPLKRFWQENFTNKRTGWLTVSKNERGQTDIMWTTHRTYHDALCGKAWNITISKDGDLVCFMESAISMWITWGYGRGTDEDYKRGMAVARWMHSKLVK